MLKTLRYLCSNLMYNLIQYSNNYSKTSPSLRQYCSDEPALNDAGAIDTLPGNSVLLKSKQYNNRRKRK